ncbi:hypothetical protein [Sulfitobacter sp. PS-8MA]|uniref:hypothetical protein n=1 Tax=Sulfitobacter sp. PS-8MA TaxID=3237707 RepID=UPI0034C68447
MAETELTPKSVSAKGKRCIVTDETESLFTMRMPSVDGAKFLALSFNQSINSAAPRKGDDHAT